MVLPFRPLGDYLKRSLVRSVGSMASRQAIDLPALRLHTSASTNTSIGQRAQGKSRTIIRGRGSSRHRFPTVPPVRKRRQSTTATHLGQAKRHLALVFPRSREHCLASTVSRRRLLLRTLSDCDGQTNRQVQRTFAKDASFQLDIQRIF